MNITVDKKHVYYFGFGANKSPEMIKAIIGRKPKGFRVHVKDYELCIQRWDELSEAARKSLSGCWGQDFSSYTMRDRKGGKVYGTCWLLTKKERDMIKNWELCGLWSRSIEIVCHDKNGIAFPAETEIVDNYRIKEVVHEARYKTYLANRAKMIRVATMDRKDFLNGKYNVKLQS